MDEGPRHYSLKIKEYLITGGLSHINHHILATS
jgi:hypothetical protein